MRYAIQRKEAEQSAAALQAGQFRAEGNARLEQGPGSGWLALCKELEFHGRIWIDTAYTGGTRFCFTPPAETAAGPHDEATPVGTALEGTPP